MTSHPAVPESETPETDALDEEATQVSFEFNEDNFDRVITLARSLERRLVEYQAKHTAIMQEADRRYDELVTALSLAQTEIKGHMRVVDELQAELRAANEAAMRWHVAASPYATPEALREALKSRA